MDIFVTASLSRWSEDFETISRDEDGGSTAVTALHAMLAGGAVGEMREAIRKVKEKEEVDPRAKRLYELNSMAESFYSYGDCEKLYFSLRMKKNMGLDFDQEQLSHALTWAVATRDFLGKPRLLGVSAIHVQQNPLVIAQLLTLVSTSISRVRGRTVVGM